MHIKNRKNDLVIPPQYSTVLFKISHLFIISGSFAFYRKHYDFSFINGMWYVTSTVYWYDPRYDYRRIMDMVSINSGIVYHVYRGRNTNNANVLLGILGIFALCYYYSWKYQRKNELWMATYMHCGVHIIGFIMNIVLYSGCIDMYE
uniref:Uncharacterized protein n=1 Tax=viral metagenome TaxID=1070528 RepID=A0A6C0JX58_9ZZZZ